MTNLRTRLQGPNPYRDQVQGKANQPITVISLLNRAETEMALPALGATQADVVERLDENAPRVAIVGGSTDHPAHVLDHVVALRAAWRIWEQGGVPFWFGIPVMCDGTAQSTVGMSYSLQSRNVAAEMIVNQMESQQYHGALVLQGCDKTPFAAVCALSHLDVIRRARAEAPVFASFAPAHVLRGGTIPPALRAELEALAARAEAAGRSSIAEDLRDALSYILQCTSTQAFQGVLSRAVQEGLLDAGDWKHLEKALAASTCHPAGGICAFNGTGNSSRLAVAALGLVHPAVELLPEPPTQAQVNAAVDALLGLAGREECSVSRIVGANWANAVRAHSATGGSTNLMMHLVAARVYLGLPTDVRDYDAVRRAVPVPDLLNYSLTQGRDIYTLARQTAAGQIRGMETIFYELGRSGVPMDLDAPTVTGTTWRERLSDQTNLSAEGVRENQVVLSCPRRSVSGVDVLSGSFFDSAVVKISGMTDAQLDEFDEKLALVLYFENEEDANAGLLDVGLIAGLRGQFPSGLVRRVCGLNGGRGAAWAEDLDEDALWNRALSGGLLKLAVVVAGQGPRAFGMPEMFGPMQHINANRELRRIAVLLSDGRYSGVTYGAAIGHLTPEAAEGGGILALETGDVLRLGLRARRIDLLDAQTLAASGEMRVLQGVEDAREALARERLARIAARRCSLAATNRMEDATDAARGVVPGAVWRWASE